jgi:hypothetical protein
MLRALPVLVILLASTPAAADGVFFGVQMSGTTLHGDLPRHVTRDSVAGMDGGFFVLGLRHGDWGLEALVGGHDLLTVHGGHEAHLWSIGPALRRYVPVTRHVELTLRAGIGRSALVGPVDSPLVQYDGVGAHASAGISVFTYFDGARLAVTAELMRHDVWLEGDGKDIDGSITGVLIGLTLSADDQR